MLAGATKIPPSLEMPTVATNLNSALESLSTPSRNALRSLGSPSVELFTRAVLLTAEQPRAALRSRRHSGWMATLPGSSSNQGTTCGRGRIRRQQVDAKPSTSRKRIPRGTMSSQTSSDLGRRRSRFGQRAAVPVHASTIYRVVVSPATSNSTRISASRQAYEGYLRRRRENPDPQARPPARYSRIRA
jgi:hypothetical protein